MERSTNTVRVLRKDGRGPNRPFIWPELPGALHESQPWGRPGIEPTLRDVLADPLVHAVMRRDGVSVAALQSLIAQVGWRLRHSSARGNAMRQSASVAEFRRAPAGTDIKL
jgi:hypothetical protein